MQLWLLKHYCMYVHVLADEHNKPYTYMYVHVYVQVQCPSVYLHVRISCYTFVRIYMYITNYLYGDILAIETVV